MIMIYLTTSGVYQDIPHVNVTTSDVPLSIPNVYFVLRTVFGIAWTGAEPTWADPKIS